MSNTFATGQRVKILPPQSKNSPADPWTGTVGILTDIGARDALVNGEVWISFSRLAVEPQGTDAGLYAVIVDKGEFKIIDAMDVSGRMNVLAGCARCDAWSRSHQRLKNAILLT